MTKWRRRGFLESICAEWRSSTRGAIRGPRASTPVSSSGPIFERLGPRVYPSVAIRAVHRLLRKRTGIGWNNVYEYDDVVDRALADAPTDYVRFRCVTPSWDNSPRRAQWAHIFTGATPEKYGSWLEQTLHAFTPPSPEEDLVFTNAWNEWAEGNHLEPDQRWGLGYLEAHARAISAFKARGTGRAAA